MSDRTDNDSYESQIRTIMDRAGMVSHTPAAVMLVEQAIAIADSHQDAHKGFELRREMIEEACFTGQPDRMIVAFSWCLALCDRDPDNFHDEDILWQYKWVLNNLTGFPQISRAQIEEMTRDMMARFEKAGAGNRAVFKIRRDMAMVMGDLDEAAAFHEKYLHTKRDHLSDCKACETDSTVTWLKQHGEYEACIKAARPITAGRESCAEVPHRTYPELLIVLVRLGDVRTAMDYHVRGYRMIARSSDFTEQFGEHAVFLGMTENLPRAFRTIEKHFPLAWGSPVPSWQFTYWLSTAYVLERLRDTGRTSIKMRLPSTFPVAANAPDGGYLLDDLIGWFRGELTRIAELYNARNGNDYFTRRIAYIDDWKTLTTPLTYPKTGKDE